MWREKNGVADAFFRSPYGKSVCSFFAGYSKRIRLARTLLSPPFVARVWLRGAARLACHGLMGSYKLPSRARLLQTPHTLHLPQHARTVIMASSLATHQFAGVNAQFKCVRARRRRGDFRDHSLPLESAATRAIFLPEGPTGTRAARPRAASPRARDSRDDWLTTPAPLFRRSAVARKNVKAARNVQVRNETRKMPSRSRNRANVQSRRFKARAPGTRPGGTRDRRAAPQTPRGVRAIPLHRARRPPTPAGRAAPPVSRLDTQTPVSAAPRPGGTPAQKPD